MPDMMSISEYAKSRGVSREAVRKQIVRYQDQLARHITIQNRTRYLDDLAQAFLDEHRMPRTVIYEPNDTETEAELQRLRGELDRLRGELVKRQEDIIALQQDKIALMETKGRYEALIEDKQRMQQELDAGKEKIQVMSDSLEKAQNIIAENETELARMQGELSSFSKSLFGFYRKSNLTASQTAPNSG